MKLSRNVSSGEVTAAILWFRLFLSGDLEKKLRSFEAEGQNQPLLRQYYRETFKLEYALDRLIKETKSGQPIPVHPSFSEAINFAVTFARVYQNLSAKGKKRLTGILQNSFAQTYGMRPLAFELMVAGHYLGKNCDVRFMDLEDKANFEFLVSKDGDEIEVECKAISADGGRNIDQKGICTVGERVRAIVTNFNDLSSRILTIKIRKRLSDVTSDALHALYTAVPKVLHGEPNISHPEFDLTLEIKPEFVLSPESIEESDVKKFVGQKVGGLGRHVLLHAHKGSRNIICAVFESETPDQVLEFISKRAAKAGTQFSHHKPSVVAMQIADMPPSALKELLDMPGVGTQKIAQNLFEGPPKRPHVNAIAFSVLPEPELFTKPGPEISNISSLVTMIRNPDAKFPSQTIDSGNPFKD